MAPGLLDLPLELLFYIIEYINEYSRVHRPARGLLALNNTCKAFRAIVYGLIPPRTPELFCPHKHPEACPWTLPLDDNLDGFFDSLVLAKLDFDYYNMMHCEGCSEVNDRIVAYLLSRQNPFPSLTSLSIYSATEGYISRWQEGQTKYSQILGQLLRSPKLRHLEIVDIKRTGPVLLPPIPSHIAVELHLESVPDERLNCILKLIGNLRVITSDTFVFASRLGDAWTRGLQCVTILSLRGPKAMFSALMTVANVERFVEDGLNLAPYISTLVSNCSKIRVDFVERSLQVELSQLPSNKFLLITAVPNLFSQLKELIIYAGVSEINWYGRGALKKNDLMALYDSLAKLPDLQQIGVGMNYPEENYEEQLHLRLHESARLLARASHSLKMIKLYPCPETFRVNEVQVMSVFDVRREGNIKVTRRLEMNSK